MCLIIFAEISRFIRVLVGFLDFFQAIYQGFVEGADIIAGLLITCGVINFLEETGTFGAGLTKIMEIAERERSFKLGVILIFFAFSVIALDIIFFIFTSSLKLVKKGRPY